MHAQCRSMLVEPTGPTGLDCWHRPRTPRGGPGQSETNPVRGALAPLRERPVQGEPRAAERCSRGDTQSVSCTTRQLIRGWSNEMGRVRESASQGRTRSDGRLTLNLKERATGPTLLDGRQMSDVAPGTDPLVQLHTNPPPPTVSRRWGCPRPAPPGAGRGRSRGGGSPARTRIHHPGDTCHTGEAGG